MISRLTAFAAVFAVIAAATIGFAASAHQTGAQTARTVRVVQLERVVVIGHRSDLARDAADR